MLATTPSLSDVGQFITGIGTLLLAIAGAGTAVFGIKTYRSQQADRRQKVTEARGRWLTELLQRFSDSPSTKLVRQELYSKQQSNLVSALRRQRQCKAGASESLTSSETTLLIALDDYLDFLSLIAYLVENDQLEISEAQRMFSWYLKDALEVPEVKEEIQEYFRPVERLYERLAEAD